MAKAIIASGDARPTSPSEELRPFRTATEGYYRTTGAPEIASLCLNPAAPAASLLALALSRTETVRGVAEVVSQGESEPEHRRALEAVVCAAEELALVIEELQRRDSLQYVGGAQ